jgi:hypothetical protein
LLWKVRPEYAIPVLGPAEALRVLLLVRELEEGEGEFPKVFISKFDLLLRSANINLVVFIFIF